LVPFLDDKTLRSNPTGGPDFARLGNWTGAGSPLGLLAFYFGKVALAITAKVHPSLVGAETPLGLETGARLLSGRFVLPRTDLQNPARSARGSPGKTSLGRPLLADLSRQTSQMSAAETNALRLHTAKVRKGPETHAQKHSPPLRSGRPCGPSSEHESGSLSGPERRLRAHLPVWVGYLPEP
jgi:hypothetical protein